MPWLTISVSFQRGVELGVIWLWGRLIHKARVRLRVRRFALIRQYVVMENPFVT